MLQTISFQPIPVLIDGHDTQGQLVLANGDLCAVLARLDGDTHDPTMQGWWHLEAGFGHCAAMGTNVFATLDEAGAWVQSKLDSVRVLEQANA